VYLLVLNHIDLIDSIVYDCFNLGLPGFPQLIDGFLTYLAATSPCLECLDYLCDYGLHLGGPLAA